MSETSLKKLSLRPKASLPAALALLLVAGCAPTPKAEVAARPPKGAVRVGADLYMVPSGTDDTGCPWFAPWSRSLMVTQAMRYKRAGGGWTFNRLEADCPPPPQGWIGGPLNPYTGKGPLIGAPPRHS